MLTIHADLVHVLAVCSTLLLCGLIVGTLLLQRSAIERGQHDVTTLPAAVQTTEWYLTTQLHIKRRHEAAKQFFRSPAYLIPCSFLITVVFLCSIMTYFGAELFAKATTPSYFLGGMTAADSKPTAELVKYQSETAFMGTMAFLGAYVWLIGTLVTRVNNCDMSPATFYYLSVRIIAACLVAAICRHIVATMVPQWPDIGLALLGFLIGWNPTLWIGDLVERGYKLWKLGIPRQRWPAEGEMPQSMTLSMIQGLVDDKVSRLMELDIDNCQKLACENAILIWLRTRYNLETIVDWIAQAQLCVLFEPDKVEALRKNGIRDIGAYYKLISSDDSLAAVQSALGISPAILLGHRASLVDDPAFQRLRELRNALLPTNAVVRLRRPAANGTARRPRLEGLTGTGIQAAAAVAMSPVS